jgi:phage-related protein
LLIIIGKIIAVTKTFILVFKALGVAFATNPIGFVITALALLVVGLVTAYQTSEKFRNIVNGALNAVIKVAENLANAFILTYNQAILPVFNKILTGLQKINPEIKLLGEIGEVAFKRIGGAAGAATPDFFDMKRAMNDIGPVAKEIGNEVPKGLKKTSDAADKAKKALQDMKDALVKLRTEAVNKLEASLKDAESQLDSARSKFNDFKNAITGNITSIVNFGKATEGENFLEGLIGQAADATSFANKVKQLIQLGLSERGIQQVLNAGFEAGTKIADELIAGGSTIVQQVNTLLASVQSVADQVGDFGARQFYQAGVTQGEALVNGILDALRQAQAELAAAVRAASQGGEIRTFGARATNLIDAIGGISGSKKQANAMKAFEAALAGSGKISKKEDAQIRARFKLAKGGIVMGPTNALIGEAGPEAVIPLSGANSARGAMGTTINITVNAGIGTSGSQVGQQIIDAIKKYERTSGAVFASA